MSKKKRVVSAGEWAGGALLRTYIDGRATLMGPGANLAVLSGDDSVGARSAAPPPLLLVGWWGAARAGGYFKVRQNGRKIRNRR